MPSTINLKSSMDADQVPLYPKKWYRKTSVIVTFCIVLIIIGLFCWSYSSETQWRAVFLTNNQVYFGHFWDLPFSQTITLNDVYYLQLTQPGQQLNGQDASQLKLVKLGNEIHGPTSQMVIPLQQVLFWETLRSDSAVVKAIKSLQ